MFLGNTIKKFDPLTINNLLAFYKTCFRNIFYFYMKKRRYFEQTEIVSFAFFNDLIQVDSRASSNRLSMYKEILYEIHVEKTYRKSPVISQLGYNFQIFRNLIMPNEFQAIYQNTKSKSSYMTDDCEFQLVDFYEDDLFNTNQQIFEKVKKLSLIYKLLKCAHLNNNSLPYNAEVIKPDVVQDIIKEEIILHFRDMFLTDYIQEIAEKIAYNFMRNILSGEYVNLTTFTTVRIANFTFLDQLRKFIRICLEETCQIKK
jgi:hypothetical protein